jgi:hypothetical protein
MKKPWSESGAKTLSSAAEFNASNCCVDQTESPP